MDTRFRFQYELYGTVVISDYELPGVEVYNGDNFDDCIRIMQETIPEYIYEAVSQKAYVFGPKESYLDNRTCTLWVREGRFIGYRLKPCDTPQYLANYLLGFGMSMVFAQRGGMAVHCCAVADDEGAVLICGESGTGKSTTAAALLESGYRLLADDMSVVGIGADKKAYALPAFPYRKLCRDAAIRAGYDLEELIYINEEKDKFLVRWDGEFRPEPVPVKAMICLCLTGETEPHVQELQGMDKFMAVATNLFLRNLLGEDKFKGEFGKRSFEISGTFPIFRVGRPAKGDSLEKMKAIVRKIAEERK